MITLRELVDFASAKVGLNVFTVYDIGVTHAMLELLFVESVRYFEQYYPIEKDAIINGSPVGVKIPDCQQVVWARYQYSTFKELIPKIDKKFFQFNTTTKLFTSEVNMRMVVHYLALMDVNYLPVYNYPFYTKALKESEIEARLKGHFKKGTLTIELNEGVYPEGVFSVDEISSTLTITGLLSITLRTGDIVKTRAVNSVLPSPMVEQQQYYVYKNIDGTYSLANNKQDLLNNTFLILTNPVNPGTFFIERVNFSMSEDLESYREFKTSFNVNTSGNYLEIINPLFLKRIELGSPVAFRLNSGTLPSPLSVGNLYYLVPIDENIVKVALSQEDAYLGNFITLGTGLTDNPLMVLKNTTLKSEDDEPIIHLEGSLGVAEINTSTLDTTLYIQEGLQGDLTLSYVNKYKAVEELDFESNYNDFFILVWMQRFCDSIGRHLMITKTEESLYDITAGDLIGLANEYAAKVYEYSETRSKWWTI